MEAKVIGLKLHICDKYSDTHTHTPPVKSLDTVKLNLVLDLQMLMLEILFIT